MDTQPTPQNPSSSPAEHGASTRPESLAGSVPETRAEPMGTSERISPAPSGGGVPAGAPPVQGAPTVDPALASNPAASTAPVSGPATAADVDVIEPEWVDKAEEVIKAHQGDPYGEEESVEDLQQDYLKKRYGYNVSDPNSDTSNTEAG